MWNALCEKLAFKCDHVRADKILSKACLLNYVDTSDSKCKVNLDGKTVKKHTLTDIFEK